MAKKGRSIIALSSTLWMPFGIMAVVCFLSAAAAFWHAWKYGAPMPSLHEPNPLSLLGRVRYINDGDVRRINRFKIVGVVAAILTVLCYLTGSIASRLQHQHTGQRPPLG
jgi:hypothetical protein